MKRAQMWSVKGAMWSVRKVLAWRCIAPGSRAGHLRKKARTHGPGWRTAHASSLVIVLGSDSWKLRWQMGWAGIRWEELRWDEVCSVKCGAWRVQCEVWSVKCEAWSVKKDNEKRSVECEVWSVKSAVWSVKSAVGSVKRRSGASNVTCETGRHFRRVHTWLAHGACKFYRWERSYIYISL